MTILRKLGPGLAAAGMIAAAAWMGGAAVKRIAPPASPTIAVVDVAAALKGLSEYKDLDSAINTKGKAIEDRINAVENEIKAEQDKLKAMPEGPQRDAAAEALREKVFHNEFDKQYATRMIVDQKADLLRKIYTKIDQAADVLAAQNGYHMVMATDEKAEVPDGSPAEVMRTITLKRMLYVDKQLDVTAELITLMNNAYAAGGKK